MFDSHCHLDFEVYDTDRRALWQAARQDGVTDVLVPAYAPSGWANLVSLCGQLPGLHAALGVHPWALEGLSAEAAQAALEQLPQLAQETGAVAIGECGLDGPVAKRAGASLARQKQMLSAQLDVAQALDLPVVLHVVKAHGEALALLQDRGPLAAGGVLHSYSGSAELVPRYAELNLHFSFAAGVTRPNAKRPLEAARAVAADRLLVESDGPDQSPHGAPSRRSEPRYVQRVIDALARARDEDRRELAQRTADNARRLFRL